MSRFPLSVAFSYHYLGIMLLSATLEDRRLHPGAAMTFQKAARQFAVKAPSTICNRISRLM